VLYVLYDILICLWHEDVDLMLTFDESVSASYYYSYYREKL